MACVVAPTASGYFVQFTGDSTTIQATGGWRSAQVAVGTLTAGTYTLTVGGYNNKKTDLTESVLFLLDDIVVTLQP